MRKLLKKIIPQFLLNWYYCFFPLLGALLYRFPSKEITVIGVTGTNGKSTVIELTTNILKEAGYNVASISSIRFQIKDKTWQNKLKMTMPGRMRIQKFLRQAVNRNCKYAIIEVTSEGIKQFRHSFIDFKTAVFTNLTREHIESHGSFENYRKEKEKLFAISKKVIVNLDDPNSDYFLKPNKERIAFTLKNEFKNNIEIIRAKDINFFDFKTQFEIKEKTIETNLLGRFNVYNALAAVCVGLSEGLDIETIAKGLKKVKKITGRLDLVAKTPFSVYVDYAHTPDALENVYKTLTTENNLICVLGSCGGGRDKWKRPELGKIADKYCDEIILTNEDPYNEDPGTILEDIRKGVSIQKPELILDRKKAIKRALELAQEGDNVVITGKGREPWMCVAKGKKIPWDDKKIVLNCLAQ